MAVDGDTIYSKGGIRTMRGWRFDGGKYFVNQNHKKVIPTLKRLQKPSFDNLKHGKPKNIPLLELSIWILKRFDLRSYYNKFLFI